MKSPSTGRRLNLDEGLVAPEGLLKCSKVKFGAAPMLIAIGNEELLIFRNDASSHDRDLESPILRLPHAVLKIFIKRIIHVAHHTDDLVECVTPGITNQIAKLDGIVGEISWSGNVVTREVFPTIVFSNKRVIMIVAVERT